VPAARALPPLPLLELLGSLDVRGCVLLLLSYVELCRQRAVSRDCRECSC